MKEKYSEPQKLLEITIQGYMKIRREYYTALNEKSSEEKLNEISLKLDEKLVKIKRMIKYLLKQLTINKIYYEKNKAIKNKLIKSFNKAMILIEERIHQKGEEKLKKHKIKSKQKRKKTRGIKNKIKELKKQMEQRKRIKDEYGLFSLTRPFRKMRAPKRKV